MNQSFYISFVLMVLAMIGVMAGGIFLACRSRGSCSSETVHEILLWSGGFVVYAVLDYCILMK